MNPLIEPKRPIWTRRRMDLINRPFSGISLNGGALFNKNFFQTTQEHFKNYQVLYLMGFITLLLFLTKIPIFPSRMILPLKLKSSDEIILKSVDYLFETKDLKVLLKNLPDTDKGKFLNLVKGRLKEYIYEDNRVITKEELEKILNDETIKSLIHSNKIS